MSFFASIKKFFENLFSTSNLEPQQKQSLRKLEAEIKNVQPCIYKNQQALPAMAEVFRLLQLNTIPLKKLFSVTIDDPDLKTRQRYTDILIETGFSSSAREKLAHLNYQNRKNDFFASDNAKHVKEAQKRDLDSLLRELSNQMFREIEKTIQGLRTFVDICNFGYTFLIKEFNGSYTPENIEQETAFESIPIERLEQPLQDLYFLTGNFTLTAAMGRAICALALEHSNGDTTESAQNQLLSHVRKISTILTRILSPENLKILICISKKDIEFQPKVSENKDKIILEYSEYLKKQFEHDSQRIESELQDEYIRTEIATVFNGHPLLYLTGYNQENSELFYKGGAGSFLWITPLQIIKTFQSIYFNDKVKSLLNDVVVEGFFNNPTYKSDFSSIFFSCSESSKHVQDFEDSFERNGKNDMALMTGYLRDSHTDPTFMKTLTQMIETVNLEAKALIQTEVTAFFQMYKRLSEIIPDSKKTTPEHIGNIRVLFTSSRNRENADYLETTLPMWNIFLDIMKNYAIMGEVRDE